MKQKFYINNTNSDNQEGVPIHELCRCASMIIFRVCYNDSKRTHAFTDTGGAVGGLSSEDMQKYLDMSEDIRGLLKSRLRNEFKITSIIDLGERSGDCFISGQSDQSQPDSMIKDEDINSILDESASIYPAKLDTGFSYKLGGI